MAVTVSVRWSVFLAFLVCLLFTPIQVFANGNSVEKALVQDLVRLQEILGKAQGMTDAASPTISLPSSVAHLAENVQAAQLLLEERFRRFEEKASELAGVAAERQAGMAQRYRAMAEQLNPIIQRLATEKTVPVELLETLKQLIQQLVSVSKQPIYGSLPYRQLNYSTGVPVSSPAVVPAYEGATSVSSSADLLGAPEGMVSAEIATLAQSLNWNPVAIYEWVKNNVATEWYWGCMKGANQTLLQKSGNDADQAALLVALLRASNYPARYVRGVIEFFPEDIAKVSDLTGIEDPQQIGEFFRRAGIPFEKVLSGQDVVNYRIEHVWVEAEIPYSNYRGMLSDAHGKVWLGLDTSIKVAGYIESNSPFDLFKEPDSPLLTIRENYLQTAHTLTPLEELKNQTQAYLDTNHGGMAYSELLQFRTQNAEHLSLLPASLQFKEVAITAEYAALPTELMHRLRLTIPGDVEPELDITLNVSELSNQKVVISYEPETVEDHEIINSWGGLDNTPSYLVRLRPVLMINGARVVVGKNGYSMGDEFPLQLELTSPSGVETLTNTVLSGYPLVLGVVSQQAVLPAQNELKNEATDILYRESLNYIDAWNRGEGELASLLGTAIVRPVPTLVSMGGVMDVVYLLGEPQGVEWKGLFIDADLRVAEPVSCGPIADGREKLFMELAGLQGSVLENRVFEDAFTVESISTAKLFGIATTGGVPVTTIDATNIETELVRLPFADNIKADIAQAVGQGYQVRILDAEVTFENWTGIGYIKENPETGEAGYMLSGSIAGGSTVLGLDAWPAEFLKRLLIPFTGEANPDPDQAHSIYPILPNLVKLATAGDDQNPVTLRVVVRDAGGVPVEGAPVNFSVVSGGGQLLDVTATTGPDGKAQARFVPGNSTAVDAIAYTRDGDIYANLVGRNLVNAELGSGTMARLASPMAVLGFAGKPDATRTLVGGDQASGSTSGNVLHSTAGAWLTLRDRFGNPVANHEVNFNAKQAIPDPASLCTDMSRYDSDTTRVVLVPQSDPCLLDMPVWGECQTAGESLVVTSLSDGTAGVGVVLGAVPYASYPIEARTDIAGGTLTQTISKTTAVVASCTAEYGAAVNEVMVAYLLHKQGSIIVDARRANEPAKFRIKSSLLSEGEQVIQNGRHLTCDPTNFSCPGVFGDGTFSISYPDSQLVTVGIGPDQWTAIETQHPGVRIGDSHPGIFESTLPLSLGRNQLWAYAAADKTVQTVFNSCNTGCGKVVSEERNLVTVIGFEIWGVDFAAPSVFTARIDANGYLTEDAVFTFSILPEAYQANLAQVHLYRNGKLIYVAGTSASGTPSVTFPKGFWFDPNSGYYLQILLNNQGDADQILSNSIPVSLAGEGDVASRFLVERVHLVNEFDSTVPSTISPPYADDFEDIPFALGVASEVKATILDKNFQPKGTLVNETPLEAGNYHFAVDYEQVTDAGFDVLSNPTFYVELERKATATGVTTKSFYPGRINERTTSAKALGQVMVHDVLLQDGSLNLSRQDFALSGRGPQLAFSRAYNNQNSPRGFKPLGRGWTHGLDLRLQVLSSDLNGPEPLPGWVTSLRGKFFTDNDLPQGPTPTVVQVNGTLFKKYNGNWYAERGKHGTLEETDGTFVFIAKDGTRYTYDQRVGEEYFASSVKDRNGNELGLFYDLLGHLVRVVDATNRELVFSYGLMPGIDDENPTRLTSVTGPDGIKLALGYDGHGYLQAVTRGSRVETYGYAQEPGIAEGEYNLTEVRDRFSHRYRYDYYGPGEIPSGMATGNRFLKSQDVIRTVTYPDDNSATFQYEVPAARQRIVTDLRGDDTTYTLNDYGNPTRIDEPLGKYTVMTWSIDEDKEKPGNVMTSRTVSAGSQAAPRPLTSYYEYDTKGNVTKETDPYNNSITSTWDQNYSLPLTRVDRNGVELRWHYDDPSIPGCLTRHEIEVEPGVFKATDSTCYTTGEVATVTDPRSNVTRFTYDAYGNPDLITVAENSSDPNEKATTDYDYDVRGRKVAVTDPLGRQTSYGYDDLDYPASITWPDRVSYALPAGSGNVKAFVYDTLGNLTSETDRTGLTLEYTYTPRNQVKTIKRSGTADDYGLKSFDYDENGNLTSETDWKGVATTHHYDELNRRDATTNRLGDSMSMGYDLAGNLTSITDYEGRITDYEYDDLNRQTRIVQPQLPGQSARGEIVKTYYDEADPKTNLKTVTDAEGHLTSYEYNGRYQATKRTNPRLDAYVWQYDDAGNLTREIDEELNETRYEYDKQNRRTFTYKNLDGREFAVEERQYDAVGNLRYVIDARGNSTETRYDEWNRPWQVITPVDAHAGTDYTTTSELDGEGRQVKVTDGNNHTRNWQRDERGLVTLATDAESQPTSYSYDLNDNVATVTNARGFLTRIGYDAEDRKLLTTAAEGTLEQQITGVVLYDRVGNPLQVRDGNGNIRVTTYNGLNLPWQQYDPVPFAANFVETLYDKNGQPISRKYRRGYVTSIHYDELGRVDLVTDPAPFEAQTVVTTYDKVGHVRTVKDKRGIVSETVYDDLYRPVEQRRDNVRLVTNEYDDAGNLTATIDGENNRVEYQYNSRNLLERTTFIDPDGTDYYAEQFYDGVGNVVSSFNEALKETVTTFDKENRLKTTTFAGETTENFYDQVGNLKQVKRPKLNGRTLDYDGLNRLTSVAEGGLLTTGYNYDGNDNLLTQTNPLGHVVEYTYDELNRKQQQIQHKPSGDLTVSYDLYDAEGNLKQLTDAMGRVFSYDYDELNRLKKTTYPQVTTPFLTIQKVETDYDANNNITTVTETKQTSGGGTLIDVTVNEWDNFERLGTSSQTHDSGSNPPIVVSYGYDNNGNRTSVGTVNGTTSYEYDARNRLKKAIVGSDETVYGYTPEGLTETISFPNGTSSHYTYYPTNRVETITHQDAAAAVISSFSYQYDANGNRSQQVEVQQGTGSQGVPVPLTTTYAYDDLDRLESFTLVADVDTTVTTYTFEGYNRKTEVVAVNGVNTVHKTYDYDETDWLTQVVDTAPADPVTISYQYDANGNTLSKTVGTGSQGVPVPLVTAYTYDAANRLVQTDQAGTVEGQYDYNAQGLRIRHYGSERGDIDYLYDDGSVLDEYVVGASGGLLAHYRYGDRLLSLDAPNDGGVQYYLHDALGSTVNLTDSAGGTKVSYTLDPWGHITDQVGSSVNRMVFTGQEHDEQTGLIYFGARYYDPDAGRFISQDSYLGEVGVPPSLHRYLYAYSNPTVFVDLMGYESVSTHDDDNSVYWNVEKDWIGPYNPTSNRHKIGVRAGDTVKLTAEMGGGEVGYKNLETAANDYFGRELKSVIDQSDISDLDPQRQFGDIRYYIDETLNPHREARMSATQKESYLKRSGSQLIKGNYSDEVTALGTAGQIATGLLGVDLPGDIRDLEYDVTHWENSWGHAGQTALDAVGLLPLVGVLKNIDEVAALTKRSDDFQSSSLMVHPFSGGGTSLTTTTTLERFKSLGSKTYGSPDKGLYLAPKAQIDQLLQSGASRRDIEIALGLNENALRRGSLVRIDVDNPFSHGLRPPTEGNEFFRPGTSLTTGGVTEGVVDAPRIGTRGVRKSTISGR